MDSREDLHQARAPGLGGQRARDKAQDKVIREESKIAEDTRLHLARKCADDWSLHPARTLHTCPAPLQRRNAKIVYLLHRLRPCSVYILYPCVLHRLPALLLLLLACVDQLVSLVAPHAPCTPGYVSAVGAAHNFASLLDHSIRAPGGDFG